MGPTWVLSAPGGSHVGPMSLAIWVDIDTAQVSQEAHHQSSHCCEDWTVRSHFLQIAAPFYVALLWRHNGRDGVSTSPASRVFTQLFIQAQIAELIKAPRQWPLRGEIHRWPVISPHKGPVTRKVFPFDDVIMGYHSLNAPGSQYSSKYCLLENDEYNSQIMVARETCHVHSFIVWSLMIYADQPMSS